MAEINPTNVTKPSNYPVVSRIKLEKNKVRTCDFEIKEFPADSLAHKIDSSVVQENSYNVSLNINNQKTETLKKRLLELLVNSSVHSVPNLIRARNGNVKIIWLIFFIISTIKGTTDFLKYDTITTVSVITEQEPQIPTISFCAYPSFDPSTPIDQIIF